MDFPWWLKLCKVTKNLKSSQKKSHTCFRISAWETKLSETKINLSLCFISVHFAGENRPVSWASLGQCIFEFVNVCSPAYAGRIKERGKALYVRRGLGCSLCTEMPVLRLLCWRTCGWVWTQGSCPDIITNSTKGEFLLMLRANHHLEAHVICSTMAVFFV